MDNPLFCDRIQLGDHPVHDGCRCDTVLVVVGEDEHSLVCADGFDPLRQFRGQFFQSLPVHGQVVHPLQGQNVGSGGQIQIIALCHGPDRFVAAFELTVEILFLQAAVPDLS